MVNFSALFLSLKRLSEVVSLPAWLNPNARVIHEVATDAQQRVRLVAVLEEGVLSWLERSQLPTLGELIVGKTLKAGAFFTHYGTFYGRGVASAAMRYADHKPLKEPPQIRAKLEVFHPGATIEMQIHPENYTSVSAAGELSGQKRLLVVGRLTEPELPALRAQAYAIGHFHLELRAPSAGGDPFELLQNHMEVFVTEIDTFGRADEIRTRPTTGELARLKDVPEERIKETFAEIIGEPFVPKDWGGERSDLVTSNVVFKGRRAVTAFAFKGPAKFKPLTVADLGKNGDQISRLFTEPADLVVLQHCHEITSAVRDHMRAFATRIGRLRPFCLIDGADTVRIMKAYTKLGFRSTNDE